jgi:putative transposase
MRLRKVSDKVNSLYAKGMTMSEIQGHLEEIYQTEISKDLISTFMLLVLMVLRGFQKR